MGLQYSRGLDAAIAVGIVIATIVNTINFINIAIVSSISTLIATFITTAVPVPRHTARQCGTQYSSSPLSSSLHLPPSQSSFLLLLTFCQRRKS
jgi:hypothetical protein